MAVVCSPVVVSSIGSMTTARVGGGGALVMARSILPTKAGSFWVWDIRSSVTWEAAFSKAGGGIGPQAVRLASTAAVATAAARRSR